LRELKTRQPDADLFFLMGADSLADFPHWRDPQAICELATPLVVRRAGAGEPDFDALRPFVGAARVAEIREMQVEMPETPISSSRIRDMIANRAEWRPFVPSSVGDYIAGRRLYGQPLRGD
jgi:nicotinate-nucleotide adenylyltransferase